MKESFDELKKHIGEYVIIRYIDQHSEIITSKLQLESVLDYVAINSIGFLSKDSVVLSVDLENEGNRIYQINSNENEIINGLKDARNKSYDTILSHHSEEWLKEYSDKYQKSELVDYSMYPTFIEGSPKYDISNSWKDYYDTDEFDKDITICEENLAKNISGLINELIKSEYPELYDICKEFEQTYGFDLLSNVYIYYMHGYKPKNANREAYVNPEIAFNYFIDKIKLDFPFEQENSNFNMKL